MVGFRSSEPDGLGKQRARTLPEEKLQRIQASTPESSSPKPLHPYTLKSAKMTVSIPRDEATNGVTKLPKLLWEHPDPKSTPMWAFLQHVNEKNGLQFKTYQELLEWSNWHIADFWGEVWDFVGIRASQPYTTVSI